MCFDSTNYPRCCMIHFTFIAKNQRFLQRISLLRYLKWVLKRYLLYNPLGCFSVKVEIKL